MAFAPPVDGGSGAVGISDPWTQSDSSIPGQEIDVEATATELTSPALANGIWYLHLRTVDAVGNWSDAAHHGPYLVDAARPEVRANAGRTTVGERMRLRYRTADNNDRTRERITVKRAGTVVASGAGLWQRRTGPRSSRFGDADPSGALSVLRSSLGRGRQLAHKLRKARLVLRLS